MSVPRSTGPRCKMLLRLLLAAIAINAQSLSVVTISSQGLDLFGPSLDKRSSLPLDAFDSKHHPQHPFLAVSRPSQKIIEFYDSRTMQPSGDTVQAEARELAFTASGDCLIAATPNGLTSVSYAKRTVVTRMTTGFAATSMVVNSARLIAVGDSATKRVRVFRIGETCKLTDSHFNAPVSGQHASDPVGLAVSPNGDHLIALNRSGFIDVYRWRGAALIAAGRVPYPGIANGFGAVFLPDSSRAYVLTNSHLMVLEADRLGALHDMKLRIPIGGQRSQAAPGQRPVATDGRMIYLTTRNSVVALSVERHKIVAETPAGPNPTAIDVSGLWGASAAP